MKSRIFVAFALIALAGCGSGTITAVKGNKKLVLTLPDSTTVTQGETAQISLKLARENMADAVTVRVEALPPGVTADNSVTFPPGSDNVSFKVTATPAAAAVSGHEVRLIMEAQGGFATKGTFKLSVKAK